MRQRGSLARRDMAVSFLSIRNGEAVPLGNIPELSVAEFRNAIISAVSGGCHLAAFFGRPVKNRRLQLIAVLADAVTSSLSLLSAEVDKAYPCLTVDCPLSPLV
jgi:hypothetical protein